MPSSKKKHIIWSSDIDLKNWVNKTKESMESEYPEICNAEECKGKDCYSCTAFYSHCVELNSIYLEDEYGNLNVSLDNNIVALADLGLWDGRKSGYRILGNNLNDIFRISEDYNTYYADGRNVYAECHHHDGTNHILYRKLKKGTNIDWFENLILKNDYKLSPQQISTYTESLLPYVKKIYGWT